ARGHDLAGVVHVDGAAVVRSAAVAAHGRDEIPLAFLVLFLGLLPRAAAEREVDRYRVCLAAVAATAADALRVDRIAAVAERLNVAVVRDVDQPAVVAVSAFA